MDCLCRITHYALRITPSLQRMSRKDRSMGFVMMLLGAALMGLGAFGPLIGLSAIGGIARAMMGGIGAGVFIVGAIIATVTNLYRKTSADQAFVRTGYGGARVVMDGGALVLPVVHRVLDVNLQTMK